MHYLIDYGANVHDLTSNNSSPLAAAIQVKDVEITQLFLKSGSFSLIKDKSQFCAVMNAAVEVGNSELVTALLAIAAGIPDLLRGHSLLRTAVIAGQEDIALLLIEAGVELTCSVFDNYNTTLVWALLDADVDPGLVVGILSEAFELGNHTMLNDLIAAGLDPNTFPVYDRMFLLTLAIRGKDKFLINLLLDTGLDLNHSPGQASEYEDEESSHLAEAAKINDVEIANLLLDRGADPSDSNALFYAVSSSHELVFMLLRAFHKAYPNGRKGYGISAFAAAIERGDLTLIEAMWSKVDIASLDSNYYSTPPLELAICSCQGELLDVTELLLKLGSNPNSLLKRISPDKETAFLAVIGTENIRMVNLFLAYNADVNLPATQGIKRTPLQKAAEMGNFDIVTLLLDHGADVNAPPAKARGATALQLAAIKGWVGIAVLLLDNGANVNVLPAKSNGRTTLEGAAEWGRPDMVKLLLERGVELESEGYRFFKSAMRLAEGNDHLAVVEFLQLHKPPDPVYVPRPLFTDSEGWTFWALETEEGFEWVEESQAFANEFSPTGWSPDVDEGITVSTSFSPHRDALSSPSVESLPSIWLDKAD